MKLFFVRKLKARTKARSSRCTCLHYRLVWRLHSGLTVAIADAHKAFIYKHIDHTKRMLTHGIVKCERYFFDQRCDRAC